MYSSDSEAVTYLTARGIGQEYLAAATSVRDQWRQRAYDGMERNIEWEGEPTSKTQDDAFPRTGLYTRNGDPVDSATVPDEVKHCEIETAAALAAGADYTSDPTVQDQDIRKAGDVDFGGAIVSRRLPQRAIDVLPTDWVRYVRGSGRIVPRTPSAYAGLYLTTRTRWR